jgi:inorganic pyrophosphatase
MSYNLRKVGTPNTTDHRVYIEKDGFPVSPFHDIPLFANQEQGILNMVVEIPRWTNAKLEVRVASPLSVSSCREDASLSQDLGGPRKPL